MATGKDFWNQVRRLVQQYTPAQPAAPQIPSGQPTAPAGQPGTQNFGPKSVAEKEKLIIEAGRKRVLLKLLYGSEWRMVEPYSFRSGKTGRLFYGWCYNHPRYDPSAPSADGHTASFKMEHIEDLEITNVPFTPKWAVEFK